MSAANPRPWAGLWQATVVPSGGVPTTWFERPDIQGSGRDGISVIHRVPAAATAGPMQRCGSVSQGVTTRGLLRCLPGHFGLLAAEFRVIYSDALVLARPRCKHILQLTQLISGFLRWQIPRKPRSALVRTRKTASTTPACVPWHVLT